MAIVDPISTSGSKLFIGADPGTGAEVIDVAEFPDFDSPPERKKTTAMADSSHTYGQGIPDPGDMKFTLWFTGMQANGNTGKNYADLKAIQDAGVPVDFSVLYSDGVSGHTWSATVHLGIPGKGPDDKMQFTCTMYPTAPIEDLVDSIPPLLTFACVDHATAGATKVSTVSPVLTGGNSYVYKVNGAIPLVGDDLTGLAWGAYTLDAVMPVIDGNYITLVEVDSDLVVVKAGRAVAVVTA